jgi:uncharacterized SAM-binding protein YcdF (DUF218 family)
VTDSKSQDSDLKSQISNLKDQPPASTTVPGRRWPRVMGGATLGILIWVFLQEIIFAAPRAEYVLIPAVIGGIALYTSRFRIVLWTGAAACALMALVITYTPLVPWLVSGPPAADMLEPVDAVVALGAGVNLSDHSLGVNSQDRVLHAMELIQSGYAPRLILPGAEGSWGPTVEGQMRSLGIKAPLIDAGPADNTHDEAMDVARLLKDHGWRRVLLVTNAWHMRRAAAVFKKAGVEVVRAPCSDSRCDMIDPRGLGDRCRALGCWLHEAIGYRIYQMRGWID